MLRCTCLHSYLSVHFGIKLHVYSRVGAPGQLMNISMEVVKIGQLIKMSPSTSHVMEAAAAAAAAAANQQPSLL